MPDHRDLYVIVAGVVLGLVLGPAVLGRLAPRAYDRLLVDPQSGREEVRARLQQGIDERVERLDATGATQVAQEQLLAELRAAAVEAESERLALVNERLDERVAWLLGLMVLAGAVMVVETLFEPGASGAAARVRGRLVSSRYALAALVVAIVLAQPALLRRLPLEFIGLGAAVVVGGVLIPWPRGMGSSCQAET